MKRCNITISQHTLMLMTLLFADEVPWVTPHFTLYCKFCNYLFRLVIRCTDILKAHKSQFQSADHSSWKRLARVSIKKMSLRNQIKVPRYGLFYFESDKTVSVVPISKSVKVLRGDNTSKRSTVELFYGSVLLKAEIIAVDGEYALSFKFLKFLWVFFDTGHLWSQTCCLCLISLESNFIPSNSFCLDGSSQ